MILVTGSTGFLGAYMVKNLVEKGYAVRGLRHTSPLPFYIPKPILEQVHWVQGDVLDLVSLQDAMDGVDAVIHSAALVSFSKHDRKKMYAVNVEGAANVVNVALEKDVKRFLHVSSVAALGRSGNEEIVTEQKKWENSNSNTHYAISKFQGELHAWRGFAEGLDGLVINPSTILGYGNWNESSCAIFKNAYREFPWYTKGINGFVGVEDVAEAAVRLLFSGISQQKFIVNSENWSFQQLFNSIAGHFHKKLPSREATKTLSDIAWRIEAVKSVITGKKALLTKETAKIARSRTGFDNHALLNALPDFSFTPLDTAIKNACDEYARALENGILTLE